MANTITKDMTFGDVLRKYPKAGQIMAEYGLHCIGCRIAATETISEGAVAHGFNEAKVNQLIKDLNDKA